MAQRNTYREDESQEERINIHELMRIRKYVKPYSIKLLLVIMVVISGSIIMTAMPMITKILIDVVLPQKKFNVSICNHCSFSNFYYFIRVRFGIQNFSYYKNRSVDN